MCTLFDIWKTAAERIYGGRAAGRPDKNFNAAQLAKGTKVEMEHTTNPKVAKEIAKDHLVEHSGYYPALAKMEKKLYKKGIWQNPILSK